MAERDLLLRMQLTGAGDVAAGLTAVAGKAGLAGVAITAIEAIKQTAAFQSTMLRLQTQTGATHAELVRATKGVKDMALAVGTSPTSLAEAMYHLESAGFRGKTALTALRVAAEGAKIGGADLTDTTTAMAAAMVAGYGKGKNAAAQMRSVMSELNATVGAGDMTFQDLNNSLQSGILATFRTAGLQIKDFGAAMAVLGDNNIRGAQASTELRMAVAALIGPSQRGAAALKDIGLAPLQLAHDFRKKDGFLVAMEDLHKALESVHDPAERANAVMQIVGRRQAGPVLTFINGLDRLRSKYKAVGDQAGSLNKEWDATRHSWQFLIDQGKVLVQLVLIRIGTAIENVARGFQKGHTWAVVLVTVLAALAGGFLLLAAGATAAGLAMAFMALMSPIGILGLIAGALTVLYFKFHSVRVIVDDVFTWIKGHWFLLAAVLLGPFAGLAAFVVEHFSAVKAITINFINDIIKAINFLIRAFDSIPSIDIDTPFGHIHFGVPKIGQIGLLTTPAQAAAHARTQSAASRLGVGKQQQLAGREPSSVPRVRAGRISPAGRAHAESQGANAALPHNFDERIGKAVAKHMAGMGVFLDGQPVGKMMVRQGNLQRARQ